MSRWPVGTTQLAAVVGHPIRHSLSPVLHNAAFAATGLDWVFVALDVDLADGEAAFAGARALGIAGLSVTMPLKEVAARSVDRLSPTAAALGAVNTVGREEGELVGHNTDGQGLLDSLRTDNQWEASGRTCVVLGAGGAARAAILALAEAGAAEVSVVNRTAGRAEAAAALAGSVGRVGTPSDAGRADLVVNATPVGMGNSDGSGWDTVTAELAGDGQLVVDLVYWPERTALLEAAAARGATTAGGLGMLVHQAARAFTLWTGVSAPVAAMAEAAQTALRR